MSLCCLEMELEESYGITAIEEAVGLKESATSQAASKELNSRQVKVVATKKDSPPPRARAAVGRQIKCSCSSPGVLKAPLGWQNLDRKVVYPQLGARKEP